MWQEVVSSKKYKKENIIKIIRNILIVSIPIALCSLLSATTKTIDALTIVRILKNIIGEEKATIQYGILNGKVDTLIMLPFSFNIAFATALIPTIAKSFAKKEIEIAKRRIKFSILITTLIGMPCTILISTYSLQILNLLFPNASDGNVMLKYSALSIIFVVLIQTINGALQGMGKLNIPVIAFAIGTVIKLLLNLLLIPNLQINGAIISTIISHIVSFIICLILLKKNIDIRFEITKFVIKPIISSIVMIVLSNLFYKKFNYIIPSNLLIIITIVFAILIYIGLVIFFKILTEEEICMLPYGKKVYKIIKKYKAKKGWKHCNSKGAENRSLGIKGLHKNKKRKKEGF